jgi:hypothetical protein
MVTLDIISTWPQFVKKAHPPPLQNRQDGTDSTQNQPQLKPFAKEPTADDLAINSKGRENQQSQRYRYTTKPIPTASSDTAAPLTSIGDLSQQPLTDIAEFTPQTTPPGRKARTPSSERQYTRSVHHRVSQPP